MAPSHTNNKESEEIVDSNRDHLAKLEKHDLARRYNTRSRKFTYFFRLPGEIRNMIWEEAAAQIPDIKLHSFLLKSYRFRLDPSMNWHCDRRYGFVPAVSTKAHTAQLGHLLSVSHEARQVVSTVRRLDRIPMDIPLDRKVNGYNAVAHINILFRPCTDILCIHLNEGGLWHWKLCSLLRLGTHPQIGGVEHLAICFTRTRYFWKFSNPPYQYGFINDHSIKKVVIGLLKLFPDLKSLVALHHDEMYLPGSGALVGIDQRLSVSDLVETQHLFNNGRIPPVIKRMQMYVNDKHECYAVRFV